MDTKIETISINGVEYVKTTDVKEMAKTENGLKYVLIRTQNAGVFAGHLESRTGQEVVLRNARRIWYWDGAASLSQLAMEGTKKPENCKFPCEVDTVNLMQVIEVIDCTEKAKKSIKGVKVWAQ